MRYNPSNSSLKMPQEDARDSLKEKIIELRTELHQRDLMTLAAQAGARVKGDQLELAAWGEDILVDSQDFIARDAQSGAMLNTMTQGLLAYYLTTADGTPPSGEWIGFSELPNGQFYAAAFQGYTGVELVKFFGSDFGRFSQAAERIGGQLKSFADLAYIFPVMPMVAIMVAGWRGDEDFPPSFRLLFDSQVRHHLPTDVCAIAGSMLTRRLIKAVDKDNDRD